MTPGHFTKAAIAGAGRFVSRLAAGRDPGCLRGRKAAMTGRPGAHAGRPEPAAARGCDTRYAVHALRLGLQGAGLLTTGRITLPVPEPDRGCLRSVRRASGRWTRSWTPSPAPGNGWPGSGTAPPSPAGPTANGSTTGCTAAT